MAKGLVVFYSRTGNTEQMAGIISESMNTVGLSTECKSVDKTSVADLLASDAIVVGSPTYYGLMSFEIKKLFDESVSKHGQLDGKIGAAFSSSANVGGGNETTVMAILQMMLIHGMTIQGDAKGDHYGPVSIGKPDARVESLCKRQGQRIAELAKKLAK